MIQLLMNYLYEPYHKKKEKIYAEAKILNDGKNFSYKGKLNLNPSPNKEARAYLEEHLEPFEEARIEQADLHSKLLHLQNRAYSPEIIEGMLPVKVKEELGLASHEYFPFCTYDLELQKSSIALECIRIIKRRLLLRTML